MPLNGSRCDVFLLWPVDGGVAVSEGTAFLQILLTILETRGWGDRETEEMGDREDREKELYTAMGVD